MGEEVKGARKEGWGGGKREREVLTHRHGPLVRLAYQALELAVLSLSLASGGWSQAAILC